MTVPWWGDGVVPVEWIGGDAGPADVGADPVAGDAGVVRLSSDLEGAASKLWSALQAVSTRLSANAVGPAAMLVARVVMAHCH